MMHAGYVAGEACQKPLHILQFEAQTVTLGKVVVNNCHLQINGRAHVALPGQGNATAVSLGVSILA